MEQTPKFVVYRDFDRRYRWRLRSGEGTTTALSGSGHSRRLGCAREMERWKREYPDVPVLDATEMGSGEPPLSRWLASLGL